MRLAGTIRFAAGAVIDSGVFFAAVRCLDRIPSNDRSHPSKLAAAMIHDVEYHEGGSFAEFHVANERLRRNGKICARNLYPWWRFLRRIAAIRAADECANLCHTFGWIAWRKDSAAPETGGQEIREQSEKAWKAGVQ